MAEINYQAYDDKCKKLLEQEEIRFAGIINDVGTLVSGGFKKEITPLEDDEAKLKSFMEFVSKVSIRKEYDQSLGPINYLAARRDKAVLVSFPFPVSKFVLLISANPSVDIEQLATKVVDIFSGIT
ncbi:MAG TPA: DUF6659 family protein [Nitrosopumilaceae archaeon]|nr:DUF6659 family protein [Nitrosopumilaceae archaeon]